MAIMIDTPLSAIPIDILGKTYITTERIDIQANKEAAVEQVLSCLQPNVQKLIKYCLLTSVVQALRMREQDLKDLSEIHTLEPLSAGVKEYGAW